MLNCGRTNGQTTSTETELAQVTYKQNLSFKTSLFFLEGVLALGSKHAVINMFSICSNAGKDGEVSIYIKTTLFQQSLLQHYLNDVVLTFYCYWILAERIQKTESETSESSQLDVDERSRRLHLRRVFSIRRIIIFAEMTARN